MGWLDRLFGKNPEPEQTAPAESFSTGDAIPPERVGLNGEYDQSGLAKRVAKAFDNDATLDDVGTLWVAQTSSTVVLKGKVPNKSYLDKAVAIARSVNGATSVDAAQVEVG
jgi:osmotically-inducible protein OsmY